MKLGIMQPYFFPYLGYFDLINFTDRWVIFDTAQYIRHGWVNRNRIIHPKSGWKYIIVPLKKHRRETPIADIQVADDRWKDRIVGQLDHYRKRAPFFKSTIDLVRDCFATDEESLARLNARCLIKTCEVLGIDFHVEYFSKMNLQIPTDLDAGEWALRISESLGAKTYVNPIGGLEIFDPQAFENAGIDLVLRESPHWVYDCRPYEFHQGLSIIDVLMWNEAKDIKKFLDSLLVGEPQLRIDAKASRNASLKTKITNSVIDQIIQ